MHIDIDSFAYLDSAIHRWDIRCKIVSLIFLVFCISSLKSFEGASISLVIALFYILLSRLPFHFILGRILYPVLFLVPLFIMLGISSGGEVLWSSPLINIYKDGIYLSSLILIKLVSIVFIFIVIWSTASFNNTACALRSLKVPSKLVFMLLFTYRYFFVFLEYLRKMKSSLKLRGYKSRGGLRSFRSTANLIGSLLVRSFEQTEQIQNAMILRGFQGDIISLERMQVRAPDLLKSFVAIIFSLILLYMEFLYE